MLYHILATKYQMILFLPEIESDMGKTFFRQVARGKELF